MTTATLPVGGCHVVRPTPLEATPGGVVGLTLQTDHHLGASNTDVDLIVSELELAAAHEDRVLLGGDLFDLILPSDKKRYTPTANHRRLWGRTDPINEVVKWGAEVFGPYADLIDGVGVGNHETAAERNHHVDAVRLLMDRLQALRSPHLKPIQELGYTSYVVYPVVDDGGRSRGRYVVWYTHGSGKATTAAAALAALSKQTNAFAADLYWQGHTHGRAAAVELMHHAGKRGQTLVKEVRVVVTGSYMTTYGNQTQADMRKNGRLSNYGAEAALRPHGPGGARVLLHFEEVGYPAKVQVTQ